MFAIAPTHKTTSENISISISHYAFIDVSSCTGTASTRLTHSRPLAHGRSSNHFYFGLRLLRHFPSQVFRMAQTDTHFEQCASALFNYAACRRTGGDEGRNRSPDLYCTYRRLRARFARVLTTAQ